MATEQIYLDHNSTTPIDPEVALAMRRCYDSGYVNPASQHRMGQRSREFLDQLRSKICDVLGAEFGGANCDQLILTSGGTESNNLALIGMAGSPPGEILISAVEHPSVVGAADYLSRIGFEVKRIPVDNHGLIRPDEVSRMIGGATKLVSIMLVNNETGVIQPVTEVAAICREAKVPMHSDAVQAVAKIPVDFQKLEVDAMTFTAHKFHGPRGIGGLLIRGGIEVRPILYGGFQQMGIRPGTEDVALAAGMCRALELYEAQAESRYRHLQKLRDEMEELIVSQFPAAVVNGGGARRAPHTLNVSFVGVDRQAFLMAADMAGLALSTGSACASGSSEPSPVLLAMGARREVVESSIRISFGVSSTRAETKRAANCILKIANDLRT